MEIPNQSYGSGTQTAPPEADRELADRLDRERADCLSTAAGHREQAGFHQGEAERYERMGEALSVALERLFPSLQRQAPPVDPYPLDPPSQVGPMPDYTNVRAGDPQAGV